MLGTLPTTALAPTRYRVEPKVLEIVNCFPVCSIVKPFHSGPLRES